MITKGFAAPASWADGIGLLATMLLAACSSTPESVVTPPNLVTIHHASAQSRGEVIAQSAISDPLVVEVRVNGALSAGIHVNWTATSGTLTPAESWTDSTGHALVYWKLGTTLGPQSARAKLDDSLSMTPIVFGLESILGPPVALIRTAGDKQSQYLDIGSSFNPLGVTAVDALGNRLPDTPISWQVVFGPVKLTPVPATFKPALGIHYTGMTPGDTVGPARVRASVPGTTITLDFDATVTPIPVPPPTNPPPHLHPPYMVYYYDTSPGPTLTTAMISWQNATAPAVDTIPAGTSMIFAHNAYWEDQSLLFMGIPGYPAGLTVPACDYATVVFATPGTYHYFDVTRPGIGGIVVVQ